MKLSRENMLSLKQDDVIYIINPYGNGNQQHVKIKTFIIDKVDDNKIYGCRSSALYLQTYIHGSINYIDDITNHDIIHAYGNIREAEEYLKLVHSGQCSFAVTNHHNSFKNEDWDY